MALNIKNSEVEELAADVANRLGITKTEALRVSLHEKKQRLDDTVAEKVEETMQWLRTEVWPKFPAERLGTAPTKSKIEEMLGYGPDGV
jgi:antitoxin VapB